MPKEDKKEEMTMDNLAILIQKGFLELKDEFKSDIDKVGERLDSMETRLDSVETKLDSMETRLERVEQKLDNIEADLNKKVDKIDHNTLKYLVEKLEKKYA